MDTSYVRGLVEAGDIDEAVSYIADYERGHSAAQMIQAGSHLARCGTDRCWEAIDYTLVDAIGNNLDMSSMDDVRLALISCLNDSNDSVKDYGATLARVFFRNFRYIPSTDFELFDALERVAFNCTHIPALYRATAALVEARDRFAADGWFDRKGLAGNISRGAQNDQGLIDDAAKCLRTIREQSLFADLGYLRSDSLVDISSLPDSAID